MKLAFLKSRMIWIISLVCGFTIIAIVIGVNLWSELKIIVSVNSDDNIVFRTLFSNNTVVGSFRFFAIFAMGILCLSAIGLVTKVLSSAEINLWGLGIKTETAMFANELKEKDRTIEKLETENKTLQAILDSLSEK